MKLINNANSPAIISPREFEFTQLLMHMHLDAYAYRVTSLR
jgi:hypothetical protein